MPIYEVWKGSGEVTMFPPEGKSPEEYEFLTHSVHGRKLKLVASFWAARFESAIVAHNAIEGWTFYPRKRGT